MVSLATGPRPAPRPGPRLREAAWGAHSISFVEYVVKIYHTEEPPDLGQALINTMDRLSSLADHNLGAQRRTLRCQLSHTGGWPRREWNDVLPASYSSWLFFCLEANQRAPTQATLTSRKHKHLRSSSKRLACCARPSTHIYFVHPSATQQHPHAPVNRTHCSTKMRHSRLNAAKTTKICEKSHQFFVRISDSM